MDEGVYESTAWLIGHLLQPHVAQGEALDLRNFTPYGREELLRNARRTARESWRGDFKASFPNKPDKKERR